MPTLSVVIPAHLGWTSVRETLDALATESEFVSEVVLVLDPVRQWQDEPPCVLPNGLNLRVVRLTRRRGAGGARNAGLEVAQGDVVLFLDAGVVPGEGLVRSHLVRYARDPSVVGVGGPVVFRSTSRVSDLFFGHCPLLFPFSLAGEGLELYWNPTANFSYLRRCNERLRFHESFPKRGGGEDVHFGQTLRNYGRVVAAPEAMVFHDFWPSMLSAMRRFARWGRAEALLACRALVEHPHTPLELMPRRPTDFHLLLALVILGSAGFPMVGGAPLVFAMAVLVPANASFRCLRCDWCDPSFPGTLFCAISRTLGYVQHLAFEFGSFTQALVCGHPRVLVTRIRFFPREARNGEDRLLLSRTTFLLNMALLIAFTVLWLVLR